MAIVCVNANDLQQTVVRLDEVMQTWGLEVSAKKTEVMSIDRHERAPKPDIIIRDRKLRNVQEFKYLGTYFTSTPTARPENKKKRKPKKEVHSRKRKKTAKKTPKPTSFQQRNLDNRLAKANGAFYGLAAPLYRRNDIQLCY